MTARPGSARMRLILAMVIYGTIGLFVRWIPLPSGVIANVRGVVGTLFLLLVTALRRDRLHRDAIRRNLKYLLPCGILLGLNWVLLFEAYRYTTVAVATVCYYLAPVFILLASPLLFGERLSGVRCACAAAAAAGMVLTSGVVQSGFQGSFTGVLLGTAAAAVYAAIVLLSKYQKDIPAFDVTIVELAVSALVLLPYNLLTASPGAMRLNIGAAALLLVVGVVHTGVAYVLYFGAIPRMETQTAALFSYIDPVVAILLSALLLRERVDLLTAVGMALVLGATLLSELLKLRQSI